MQHASAAANQRWKAKLISEFSAFLMETFLTFGIYNYINMSVRKPNKSWNFQKKLEIFQN
jgi:hypothetical protein